MKLRNKKTGEIIILIDHIFDNYNSLAELNEEWEDVPEKPKEYWFIDYDGGIIPFNRNKETVTDNLMKSIGNYFETKEEAEKAVEKLKAWKRLKDYNVKFNLDFVRNKIDFTYSVNNPLLSVLDGEEQIFNNMKIIFGGKNE